jgi:hypothetical protein
MGLGGTIPLIMKAAAAGFGETAAAGGGGDVVTKSCRFDSASSSGLSRDPAADGDRQTFTFACWIKRSKLGAAQRIFSSAHSTADDRLAFKADDTLEWNCQTNPSLNVNDYTKAKFRDVAAWLHVCLSVDTTQAAAADRIRLYVNNVLQEMNGDNQPPQDTVFGLMGTGYIHTIGSYTSTAEYIGGYLGDIYFVDGTAAAPTAFAEEDATTGQWKPKAFSGTYGTNGFHLDFEDDTDIGNDVSGEGNDFTATNLAASDVVEDTPQSNFCTLNTQSGPPRGAITFSEGNLKATGGYDSSAGYFPRIMGTMAASSGKWFYEVRVNTTLASSYEVGFKGVNTTWPSGSHALDGGSSTWSTESEIGYSDYHGGIKHCNSSTPETTDAGTYGTAGTVIGIALDLDASPRTMKVWNEGTGYDSADLPTGGEDAFYPCIDLTQTTSGSLTVNFGQDATFVGTESGTTYTTDASGGDTGGEFTMQPPAGYKAWTTKNLPEPTIAKSSEHFNTLTYASSGAKTGVGFQPDLVWVKARGNTYDHELTDSVRGVEKALSSNDTGVESTDNTGLTVFGSDGFTVGAGTNYSTSSMVAWSWKGGTEVTQSGTHTYELALELTSSDYMGWGGMMMYTTPRLEVIEGTTSLGFATVGYYQSTANYVIKTNNVDAIKIVWDYNSSAGGDLDQQGATLKNGSTVIQTAYTTSDTLYDGEVWITQSTTSDETTEGTLAVGTPASYPVRNANSDAGFSIAKWTGDSSTTATQTVNHGLGVAPEMIIAKGRTSTSAYGTANWWVYHKDVTSGSFLSLDTTGTPTSFYGAGMTSIGATSVDFSNDTMMYHYLNYGGDGIPVGMGGRAAEDYVAYMFASVEGYSKVGSFSGSSTAFIYTGFRPSFILAKRYDSTGGNWLMFDDKREGYNVDNDDLMANSSAIEATTDHIDILSNGFKIRTSDADLNAGTVIYYAVGQSLKYANAR